MLDELQQLVDDLATELQRSVAVDDVAIQLLAASAHYGAIDPPRIDSVLARRADAAIVAHVRTFGIDHAVDPVHIPDSAELRTLPRIAVPLRDGSDLYGFLWLIDADPPVTPSELTMATKGARAITELLRHNAAQLDDLQAQDTPLLAGLFGDDRARRDAALAAVTGPDRLGPGASLRIAAIRFRDGDGDTAEAARHAVTRSVALRQLIGPALVAPVGGYLAVVSRAGPRPPSAAWRERFWSTARAAEPALAVGLADQLPGEPPGPSFGRAAYAADVAQRVGEFDGFACWTELGAWQLLFGLPWTPATARELHPPLAPLLRPEHRLLATTLLTYLDSGGDAAATVAALHIHRTTLYYRMDKIRDLVGSSWSTGTGRLGAHAALVLATRLAPADA
ncbi:helix-turn-helix domain-containing protein [Jiangella muralis]|uniref:helix-turn-helix domain-containing protein n=1 Tax=Jiangella muralis TaxID=702383 RepID=UPI00069CFCC8|nr:helix-turn-helix domain-containing protein [Jiangella muralis]